RIAAYFEDGTSVQGDLMVESDETKSVMRVNLLTAEENRLDLIPLAPVNITMSYFREQARFIRGKYHPSVKLCPPEEYTSFIIAMADICDPENPETWKFGLSAALWGSSEQPPTNKERVKLFESCAANYCESLKPAALWLPDDTFIPPDVFHVCTNPVKWDNHNGRTTIAGDAAHPISPFRGQDLNNALQDAALYIGAIRAVVSSAKSLEEAVSECDAEILERSREEIGVSNVQTNVYIWP
ncbi:uncharacterized protein K441DRAFT_717404, partial [Cenococcum geophilum 1.58]|uniref:uncharacterized protein n=1 Tax=Cenococcum geophilum 1.58 TaxID=794803 RepID=UPI00358F0CEA